MAPQPIQLLLFLYRPRLQDVCQHRKRSDDKPLCCNYLVTPVSFMSFSPLFFYLPVSPHGYYLYFSHIFHPFHILYTDTSCFFPCTVYIFCMSYSSHYARPSALFRRSPAGIPPTAKRFFIDQYRGVPGQWIELAETLWMLQLKPVKRSPWDSALYKCAPSC